MNKLIISIDGPAGSGKQRIAKYISKKYSLYHLDSGILYRRLASIIIKKKIKYNDKKKLKIFLSLINFLSARSHFKLRNEKISKLASKIAIIYEVRKFINDNQKAIVKKKLQSHKGCVIDGRDIGSKVFKNANIKLFNANALFFFHKMSLYYFFYYYKFLNFFEFQTIYLHNFLPRHLPAL